MNGHNVLGRPQTVSLPPSQEQMPSDYIGADAVETRSGRFMISTALLQGEFMVAQSVPIGDVFYPCVVPMCCTVVLGNEYKVIEYSEDAPGSIDPITQQRRPGSGREVFRGRQAWDGLWTAWCAPPHSRRVALTIDLMRPVTPTQVPFLEAAGDGDKLVVREIGTGDVIGSVWDYTNEFLLCIPLGSMTFELEMPGDELTEPEKFYITGSGCQTPLICCCPSLCFCISACRHVRFDILDENEAVVGHIVKASPSCSEVCDTSCRLSPTADRFRVEVVEPEWLLRTKGYDSPGRKQARSEDIYALLMAAVMFLDLRQFSCCQTESEIY
ncbi:U3 snoRNP protein [Perkinsus chesapeaki]|uniref:U3 snoRNP protein n=1 Tax=Perkinsus chesapeaki TaxID=330153 RepID=A0A7J6LG18_PERCH|nr:U3 snoRNP protein [Perkinsus chesapeaki]